MDKTLSLIIMLHEQTEAISYFLILLWRFSKKPAQTCIRLLDTLPLNIDFGCAVIESYLDGCRFNDVGRGCRCLWAEGVGGGADESDRTGAVLKETAPLSINQSGWKISSGCCITTATVSDLCCHLCRVLVKQVRTHHKSTIWAFFFLSFREKQRWEKIPGPPRK